MKPELIPSASVTFNEYTIVVATWSQCSLSFYDFMFEPKVLDIDCSNFELGKEVRQALNQSRAIDFDEWEYIYQKVRELNISEKINRDIMAKHNIKNLNNFLKKDRVVKINIYNNYINITPTHQDSINGIRGIDDFNDIILPINSSFDKIGHQIRYVYGFCTSKFAQ